MVPHNHCYEVVHSEIGEEFLCFLSHGTKSSNFMQSKFLSTDLTGTSGHYTSINTETAVLVPITSLGKCCKVGGCFALGLHASFFLKYKPKFSSQIASSA